MDESRRDTGARAVRRRRPADGLARARVVAPAAPGGGYGARAARAFVPRRGRARLSLARVRRPPPGAAMRVAGARVAPSLPPVGEGSYFELVVVVVVEA